LLGRVEIWKARPKHKLDNDSKAEKNETPSKEIKLKNIKKSASIGAL
jgi:hypothetical protein